MTETVPRPRGGDAGGGAATAAEPGDSLLLCAPLGIEARALRRGTVSVMRYLRVPAPARTGRAR